MWVENIVADVNKKGVISYYDITVSIVVISSGV